MVDYVIRVYQDGEEGYNIKDVSTEKGEDFARLVAFLMDGGAGDVYEDDRGMLELAKTYTEVEA